MESLPISFMKRKIGSSDTSKCEGVSVAVFGETAFAGCGIELKNDPLTVAGN